MRLYYTGASPDNLRKAREHAPSHSHGYGWTPQKMVDHDAPYFLDNGAYTDDFDAAEWEQLLRDAKDMPRLPDFIVLPDVYGDAEATLERHREMLRGARHDREPERHARYMLVTRGDFTRYAVLQPGYPVGWQVERYAEMGGVDGLFLGGPTRWKRAIGHEAARHARSHGMPIHVGNPGGADGLEWAYRCGFDSADTTSVFQNQYFHYLDRLENATEETGSSDLPSQQETMAAYADD